LPKRIPMAPTTIMPIQKAAKSRQQNTSRHLRFSGGAMPHSGSFFGPQQSQQPAQQPFLGAAAPGAAAPGAAGAGAAASALLPPNMLARGALTPQHPSNSRSNKKCSSRGACSWQHVLRGCTSLTFGRGDHCNERTIGFLSYLCRRSSRPDPLVDRLTHLYRPRRQCGPHLPRARPCSALENVP
jgi:hypothetical protein